MRCCDRWVTWRRAAFPGRPERPGKAVLHALIVGLAVLASGCGKPAGTPPDAASAEQASPQANGVAESGKQFSADALKSDTPETAVGKFLEAVRTGNDRVAETMFTDLARDRIKELDIQVAPRGSDTAKFEIGKADFLGDDGARVPCKWTDIDREGKARVDEMTWMLRKQSEGWRVAGMAAVVLEGEDPLLLDFENPKETLQKLERLREEIAERSSPQAEEPRQAGNAGNSEEQIRR